MSLNLDVPAEIETELRSRAASLGVSVEGYAAQLLAESVSKSGTKLSGSQIVELWRSSGLIGYRSDIRDSGKHARGIRKAAQERRP